MKTTGAPARSELRRSGPTRHTLQQARVFAVLWAIAHIAHMLHGANPDGPLVWIVLLAALLLIDRPTSRARLVFLATAELIFAANRLPVIDNHVVIMSFVNLGLLACVAISFRRDADAGDSSPPVGALPYVRLVLLIAYGAAALAKLNDGFFQSETSCAVEHFNATMSVFGGTTLHAAGPVADALPFLVAGAELAIPILLLVPATRLVGVVLTILFHLAMTFSPTAYTGLSFTFVLLAMVFLFLPDRAALQIRRRIRTITRWHGVQLRCSRSGLFIVAAMTVGALVSQQVFEFITVEQTGNWLVRGPAALVIALLLLDATWQAWRRRWPRSTPLNPRRIAYFVLVALVVLNASAPYVGAKTITSFTMYSNLETEGSTTNHFFLPRLALASGQDDLVRIIDSSNGWLANVRERGYLLTWHELRRRLTGDPSASVTYERGGTVFAYRHARENADLVALDPIAARALAYRLVDPDGARCQW